MAKKFDFTRPAATNVPGAKLATAKVPANVANNLPPLPKPGDPPMRRGTVMMSDYTRRNLLKLGWKEGDPIPGDLGQRIKEIQEEVERERSEAAHDMPDYKPPTAKLVNIEDLPLDKQAELRGYITEYKVQAEQEALHEQARQEMEADIDPNAAPSVQEAQRVAIAAQMDSRRNYEVAPSQAPPLPVPEGRTLGSVTNLNPTVDKLAQMQQIQNKIERGEDPAAKPVVAPEEPEADAGSALPVTNCQRCGWHLDRAFDVTITDDDKLRYRAALLQPFNGRYHEEVPLLDGAIRVRFRSLLVKETILLKRQLHYDVAAGDILGDGAFLQEMMEYRLAMSIEQLYFEGGDTIDVPPIHEIPYDPPVGNKETVLVPMRNKLYEDILTSEPLLKMVRDQQHLFQRKIEALEVLSQQPDFLKGIAPGR